MDGFLINMRARKESEEIKMEEGCTGLSGNGITGILNSSCLHRIGVSVVSLAWVLMLAPLTVAPVGAQEAGHAPVVLPTDRTVLPIPEPQYPHSTVFNARNATPPPRFEVKTPLGAPNVLIVLIDDMGFGQSSAFGGPIHMPTVESLASA